jgi:hypothetical protein
MAKRPGFMDYVESGVMVDDIMKPEPKPRFSWLSHGMHMLVDKTVAPLKSFVTKLKVLPVDEELETLDFATPYNESIKDTNKDNPYSSDVHFSVLDSKLDEQKKMAQMGPMKRR